MKRFLLSMLFAAFLTDCASNPGTVAYSTSPGKVLVIEVGDDGKPVPGAQWTVDGRTIKLDRATEALTAPGIPHPLKSYRTSPVE